jgi:hypothetical protein
MPRRKHPTTIDEYTSWAKETLDVDFNSDYNRKTYDLNVTYVHNEASNHAFFRGIDKFLEDSQEDYLKKKKAALFMAKPTVILDKKPYESVVNKSFRYNVIWNTQFPSVPTYDWVAPDEWLTPDNWFSRINDSVRTTIVCKYIDGPRFLTERLTKYATECKLASRYRSQQRDDGYYAYHFYIKIPVSMIDKDKEVVNVNVDIEIQLTTQLQEVLRQIAHLYYEDMRIGKSSDPSSWKWEFGSNRFRAGYLGHTLHLLEAIILDIRNASLKSPKK